MGLDSTALLAQQQLLLAQQRAAMLGFSMGVAAQSSGGRKKQCEIYVGNLAGGVVGGDMLRELFGSLVSALPAFEPGRGIPVTNVQLCSNGCYAFVEFRDEILASTAMKFHGLEVAGRPIKIGRPTGYIVPPTGDVVGLPVPQEVLNELGVAGVASSFTPAVSGVNGGTQAKKQRELYVGNLAQGNVTAQMIRELFTEPLKAALGAEEPVIHVELEPGGKFGFVEFRDDNTATMALSLFNNVPFYDRPLRVGRPQGYTDIDTGAVTGSILPHSDMPLTIMPQIPILTPIVAPLMMLAAPKMEEQGQL